MTNTAKAPTVAEEMAKFNGFSTNNGITVKPEDTTNGASSTLSAEEKAAGARIVSDTAKETKLTDAEETAAIEAATEAKGDDLTADEADEAVAAALAEKNKPSKTKNNDTPEERLRRAQAGRRKEAAARARAERETASLRDRIAALEAGGTKPLTKDGKPANTDDKASKEPDPKDFEFGEVDAKYIRALARYEARQELAEASKNQQTEQQTAQQRRAEKEATDRRTLFEDKGHELFDDFQEVLDSVALPESDPDAWPLSATLVPLLLDSPDHGPSIFRDLSRNPKEARRIAKLNPREQERWFYREEAKLEAEAGKAEAGGEQDEDGAAGSREVKKPVERRESRAPKVPNRNRGGTHQQPVNAATQDFRAFEAMATAAAAPRR